LLVSGSPGSGKSTLAYSIAEELKLGPVLHWPITSRSNLSDALYRYDAIGRLQEANLSRTEAAATAVPDIGRFVRLGQLGTALVPQIRPRVLLIDEIDKSDVDLPSDLLHIFDTGEFTIPELARLPEDQESVNVVAERSGMIAVRRGLIRCLAFPVVIITSNGERALPPAFLRRCLQVEIAKPDHEQLANIIEAQLGPEVLNESAELIERFVQRGLHADLATDQLINAIYLTTSARRPPESSRDRVIDSIFSDLGSLT
jgi:MoxR-like ATPase